MSTQQTPNKQTSILTFVCYSVSGTCSDPGGSSGSFHYVQDVNKLCSNVDAY
jgi:hypothetical protein